MFANKSVIRFHFNIVLEVLAWVTRHENKTISTPFGKKKFKLPMFPDFMTLYTENLSNSLKYLLAFITSSSRLKGKESIQKNLLYFQMGDWIFTHKRKSLDSYLTP